MSIVVVTNCTPVAKGWEAEFQERFRKRAGLIDKEPGFIRNEVHRPRPLELDHAAGSFVEDEDTQDYYQVKTWWKSLDEFIAWTRSESFAEAHRNRPPKEMFAGSSRLEIHEAFLSTDLDID